MDEVVVVVVAVVVGGGDGGDGGDDDDGCREQYWQVRNGRMEGVATGRSRKDQVSLSLHFIRSQ